MKSSIIIINKNEEGIKDTLISLSKLTENDFEVIVVDGSNHKFDSIKSKYPKVKWLDFISQSTNKVSIAEQRNVGINNAQGEIIVFIDASCILDNTEWLKNLINPILKESEDIVRGTLSNTQNYITVTEKINSSVYVTEAPTINVAIRKSVFEDIGLFDESYSYGSDMDFTWRATYAGYKIRYVQDAGVSHDFGDTKQNFKRYKNYGKARAKLYFNHPYYLSRIVNYELQSIIYFAIICLAPVVVIFPLYSVVLLGLIVLLLKGGNPSKELTERFSFGWGMILGFFSELSLKMKASSAS